MSRFKRVLLAALAEQGVEQPIPSKVGVKTSGVPIEDEVFTPRISCHGGDASGAASNHRPSAS
jgi:hypothetical protein